MTRAIKNISESYYFKPLILRGLVFALAICAGFYMYFVGSTVAGAIENEKNIDIISQAEHEKVELEKEYMNLVNKFDLEYALDVGFADQSRNTVYLSRYEAVAQR